MKLALLWLPLLPGLALKYAGEPLSEQGPVEVWEYKPGEGYAWASSRGNRAGASSTTAVAPFDLTASLAWKWQHPWGKYFASPTGVVIDGEGSIYMTELAGARKFSPDGKEIWAYKKHFEAEMVDSPTISHGNLLFSSNDGFMHALSMETGERIWSSHLKGHCDGTNGFVSAHAGVIVTSCNANEVSDEDVIALDEKAGGILWTYRPDNTVWNFLATFPDDETVTFQDKDGKAYRLSLQTGTLIWKSGGKYNTWTDGSAQVGPNGILYAVNTEWGADKGPDAPGKLTAYRVTDGGLLWSATTPRPPNNVPAVGKLAGRRGLSVVQPMGQQSLQGAPYEVRAYDAETGALQWTFHGPSQKGGFQAGDLEGKPYRESTGLRGLTYPNPWSAPAIDGNGTVYVGNQEGPFYALRDLNGDGEVSGPGEVSVFDAGSCYSGAAGPAIAPGMVAMATIDTLYVFKAGGQHAPQ